MMALPHSVNLHGVEADMPRQAPAAKCELSIGAL
jgi:hypothetical protein